MTPNLILLEACVRKELQQLEKLQEKIFTSIAREVDQVVPKSEGWHRELLEQMMLDIPYIH